MVECKFHVAIIGAGLGGLATGIAITRAGHKVTILERAPALTEIGAGIQVPPNSTRILKQWNLLERIHECSNSPSEFVFRSFSNGNKLASVNLELISKEKHGLPYLHVHRADYHALLHEEFERLGGTIKLNSEVLSIDISRPAVHIKGCSEFLADLVIGADGLKSICRDSLFGNQGLPRPTGDVAYRCIVKAEKVERDTDLDLLLHSSDFHYWIGPGQHVICYKLREANLFNIVIACTDDVRSESTNISLADISELTGKLEGWDTRLQNLVKLSAEGGMGKLMFVGELETWIHSSGHLALLGDACHATLPYLAQGAALAIEDAAVLGRLFEKISHPNQLYDLLVIYETLRKPRTTRIVKAAAASRRVLHLSNGPIQEERDRQLREELPFAGFPHPWADPAMQDYLFAYDAQDEVDKAWSRYLSGTFPGVTGAWKRSNSIEKPTTTRSFKVS